VAERLSANLRKSDNVARLGGDEFAIMLPELNDTGIAIMLARKLTEAISQTFVIAEQKIKIGVSIGIALYPVDSREPDDLLKKAEEAMHAAKKEGSNTFRLYGAISPE
jgi:diguanylate cyclase (GGDEF)-like protein